MPPSLLDSAPRGRFTFVAGKGGTGKSTTAAALALTWADAGHAIHLISTDPAPSLTDIFGVTNLRHPVASPCAPNLLLEELDAEHMTGAWLERVRAPLEQLIEQGTYLDAEDVKRLTHLTLPGTDEVAAALRITELADGAAHIVVDTAPTGHTLRLLDTALLVESWAAVFRAMSDKVATIALTMTGARFRLPGEDVVDEMTGVAARFRTALEQAQFVVVTRDDEVVAAETTRLADALEKRGLTIAAIAVVGGVSRNYSGDGGPVFLDVPRLADARGRTDVRGCAGLRAWRDAVRQAPVREAPVREAPTSAPAAARRRDKPLEIAHGDAAVEVWLRARTQRLLWFAGKGGVGKSTCASAVALSLSSTRRVLLCSTDPAGSLREVLELDAAADGFEVRPGLRVLQVDAAAQLDEWKSHYRAEAEEVFEKLGVGGTATMDRNIMTAMWDAVPPGIDELFALSEIVDAAETDETIVIDSAPTGHFLRLIESPELALDWTHAILRILLKYGVAGALDGFSERMLAFARQLKQLNAMLKDPAASGVFVVTMQEPVVEAQSERLIEALRKANVAVAARIVNRAQQAVLRSSMTTVIAPVMTHPPTGLPDLEAFLAQWELA